MVYRTRIYYNAEQRAQIWDCWRRGDSITSIGRIFDRPSSSIFNLLERSGGIRPSERTRSSLSLTLDEREEISRGIVSGCSIRSIALSLNRSPSTVSREINRNGGMNAYRAVQADKAAWERSLRPKICKLANNRALAKVVESKLKRHWSPQQIAGWLRKKHLKHEQQRVSHETIYRTLYVQTRGALKKELQLYLRSKRAVRRSKHSSLKRQGLGKITNTISISERPASAEDADESIRKRCRNSGTCTHKAFSQTAERAIPFPDMGSRNRNGASWEIYACYWHQCIFLRPSQSMAKRLERKYQPFTQTVFT